MAETRLWPWNRVPELAHLPARAREDLWSAVSEETGRGQRAVWHVFLAFLLGCLLTGILMGYFHEHIPIRRRIVDPLLAMPIVILPASVIAQHWRVTRRHVQARIRERFAGTRLPVCFSCGYNLRGLPDDQPTCPECGDDVNNEDTGTNEAV